MSTTSTTSRPLPRPLRLVSSSTRAPSLGSGLPTPLSAKGGPLSAPLNLGRNGFHEFDAPKSRPNPRRQSSISYNTGPSKTRTGGLVRSNSLGGNVQEVERDDENRSPKIPLPDVREIEPVTLAEKHADLLRFIAQKESKCLELRTQLAQHEADLLLLKRKWERIVSKGSPSSVRPEGDMLDGIREGVQSGLGKVLAVLEPTAQAQVLQPKSVHQHTPDKRASISTVSSRSPRARSSLSGSGSSAGSLFDDLVGLDSMSSASSVGSDSTPCPSPEDKISTMSSRPSQAAKRNSSSFTRSTPNCELERNEATIHVDDDPSEKKRRSRPSSVNLSAPLSAASLSPTLSKQMSNWVPELNKKWEELKGNETLSKQSKRASTLLNDVLAAFSQPSLTSSSSTLAPAPTLASKRTLMHSPSHTTLDSAFFDPVTAAGIGAGSRSGPGLASKSPSLLDDEDDFAQAGDVLKPEVKPPAVKARDVGTGDAEDEWNW